MAFPYSLVIFDLDGTLIDTAIDITEALNRTLRELNLCEFDQSTVRSWIGEGARALVATALQAQHDFRDVETVMPMMMRHYQQCLFLSASVYPGVKETLQALRHAGRHLAVCTNKPARFVEPLLSHSGLAVFFDAVVGQGVLPKVKPDPMPLVYLSRQFSLSPSQCLMVGDSETDYLAARSAQMSCALVRYGYHRAFNLDTAQTVLTMDKMPELLNLSSSNP